jgi:hypothetical protein
LPGYSPLSSTLPLPCLNHFSAYISPTKQKQRKTKETLYCHWATSTPTLLGSLPSPAGGAGLLTTSAQWANLASSLLPSLPDSVLPTQPACCPSSPLSPFLRQWCCKSEIAIPQHNLDIDTSAFDDFCLSLLCRGVGYSQFMGVLSPSTSLCHRGFIACFYHPFVVGLFILPLLLCSLPLHSFPSIPLHRGSSGGGIG